MTEVKLDFEKQGGLVPVIVTDYKTGQVLMLAYMNEAGRRQTGHARPSERHVGQMV